MHARAHMCRVFPRMSESFDPPTLLSETFQIPRCPNEISFIMYMERGREREREREREQGRTFKKRGRNEVLLLVLLFRKELLNLPRTPS